MNKTQGNREKNKGRKRKNTREMQKIKGVEKRGVQMAFEF